MIDFGALVKPQKKRHIVVLVSAALIEAKMWYFLVIMRPNVEFSTSMKLVYSQMQDVNLVLERVSK